MLLESVSQQVGNDLITKRTTHPSEIIFMLCKKYAPGGVEERNQLLDNLQKIPEYKTTGEAVEAIQNWNRRRQRARELGLTLPDCMVALRNIAGAMSTAMA